MSKFHLQYDYTYITLVPTICIDLKNVEFAAGWLFWVLFFYPKGEER
jgi:hypothetical protein